MLCNWQILEEGTVDEAVDVFYKRVNDEMGKSIPRKKSIRRKCDLPWLDEQAREAMKEKHEAEGTANYEIAALKCRQILRQSKSNYMEKTQDDLANLRRGSKKWWRLTEQIMNRQANPSFFPALKDSQGKWCVTAKDKANAFAKCWSEEFQMLPEVEEQFFPAPLQAMNDFVPIRERDVKKVLATLRED